jgi:MoaA/NifB/PqqE/SkfB family radical SAM enzyme
MPDTIDEAEGTAHAVSGVKGASGAGSGTSRQKRARVKRTNLAAFENYLIAKYERLAGKVRTRSYPYLMTIDPSSICQLRCPGCYTGIFNERRRRKSKDLDDARSTSRLTRGVLDAIFGETGDLLFYCHFYNWGEPLLNDQLPDFIRSASQRDIYTKVDTNLSLRCTDQKLEQLLLSGLDELAVSIDGFSQETYGKYRVNGRFDLVMENLTRLVAIRQRLGAHTRINWNLLIFSFNENEVPEIARFCAERNIDFVPKDATFTAKMPPEWLPAYRREGRPNPYRQHRSAELTSSDWFTPSGMLPLHVGRPEGRTCAWHYGYTVVNADGAVHPCCGLYRPKDDFGRVTAEPGSFGRVWNNENFEAVRRDFPQGTQSRATGPTTACTKCRHSDIYRDQYTVLDREIMMKYWSLNPASDARQLDAYFTLLQTSPSQFAAAYAARYDAMPGKSGSGSADVGRKDLPSKKP